METDSGSGGPPITAWWGKLGSGAGAYHPLIRYTIDVAVVGEPMWSEDRAPATGDPIRLGLGMEDSV